jgi:hypothetical protein
MTETRGVASTISVKHLWSRTKDCDIRLLSILSFKRIFYHLRFLVCLAVCLGVRIVVLSSLTFQGCHVRYTGSRKDTNEAAFRSSDVSKLKGGAKLVGKAPTRRRVGRATRLSLKKELSSIGSK